MPDKPQPTKKSFSPDWLVHGVLTKIGDTFDRLTGRGWKPSSSLATSELVERLKRLLDAEVKENGDKRKFVPHNIKLKMQWDKFSTDSDDSLKKLEAELLTAAVDHINDRRYYTFAPLAIEVKPDYFTSGVKLFVGYEKFDEDEREAELNVTVPGFNVSDLIPEEKHQLASERVVFRFSIDGMPMEKTLDLVEGRRLSIGRTKENDLTIDDPSVSKFHASILLAANSGLTIADTGSTNGTFVRGERIAYGNAAEVAPGDEVKFGLVKISFEFLEKPMLVPETARLELPKTETYSVGEFEFTKKISDEIADAPIPIPFEASGQVQKQPETVAEQPAATEQEIKLDLPHKQ